MCTAPKAVLISEKEHFDVRTMFTAPKAVLIGEVSACLCLCYKHQALARLAVPTGACLHRLYGCETALRLHSCSLLLKRPSVLRRSLLTSRICQTVKVYPMQLSCNQVAMDCH